MSRKIILEPDYYGEGEKLYKKKSVTFEEGVTVLVGCNGIGKTTLLHQIKDNLRKNKIPYMEYDNLHDGGSNARAQAGFEENFAFLATSMCASEGENIIMNIGQFAGKLRNFILTGKNENHYHRLIESFQALTDENKKEEHIPDERWILLDAVDSGLSVDNIVELKEYLFNTILNDDHGKKVYIVVSANEYEMARGENCINVYECKNIKFNDYEEYRKCILESKKYKEKRLNKGE